MMPGGGMGSGMGGSGGMTMPPVSSMPFYMAAQQSMVSASDLRDYGAVDLAFGTSAFGSVVAHGGRSQRSISPEHGPRWS